MKLLVQELKGHSYRLLDLDSRNYFRAMKKDYDLTVGSILHTANEDITGDLISEMTIILEVVGDSTKARVEVCADDVKVGDLIDGVPVLNIGKTYAKQGKKMAFAYFK